MSNQFLPVAYAFTNVGVFDSNDGINFITGLDANDNIVTVTASNLGDRIIVYPDRIFIGNNTINATVNSTIYTGSAANGTTITPGGPNTAIQFNASGGFGGNSQLTFDITTNRFQVGNSTVNVAVNSIGLFVGGAIVNSVTIAMGANVSLNTTAFFAGNSTQNTVQNSSGFFINGAPSTALTRVINTQTISLTSNSTSTVCTLTLAPGTWELEGLGFFNGAGAATANDWIFGICNSANSFSGLYSPSTHDRHPSGTDFMKTLFLLPQRMTPAITTSYFFNAQHTGSGSYGITAVVQATKVG